jgi:hypothetical protein
VAYCWTRIGPTKQPHWPLIKPIREVSLLEEKRSQRGSNPHNCLEKSKLRRRGRERKLTNTHQGDRVPVNMVSTDDSGRVACKKERRGLESVQLRPTKPRLTEIIRRAAAIALCGLLV